MNAPTLENSNLIQDLDETHCVASGELALVKRVSDDGIPVVTGWHRKCANLLIDQIDERFRGCNDYYVGGNVYLYFSFQQLITRDFRGPDFFYVRGASRHPIRETWTLWKEDGQAPNVVVALTSPSTREADFGSKFRIYRDRLRVPEYFIYDPETFELVGWRLQSSKYETIEKDECGRLPSNELGLSLGTWDGEVVRDAATWLRFFRPDGQVSQTHVEAAGQQNEGPRIIVDEDQARVDSAEV